MLAKEQECSQNSTGAGSINEMRDEAISTRLYLTALAAIHSRDERLMQAQPTAEREATQAEGAGSLHDVQAVHESSTGAASAALVSAPKEADTLQGTAVQIREPVTEKTDRAWIGWAALLAVVVAFCWQRFVRNRCTNCRSTRVERTGETGRSLARHQTSVGTKQPRHKDAPCADYLCEGPVRLPLHTMPGRMVEGAQGRASVRLEHRALLLRLLIRRT